MSTIAIHPYADLFPLISETEQTQLVADIKANGLQEPIIRLDGKILDGRNRYRACLAAGVKPDFNEFLGTDAEAKAFVVSKNLMRRHLSSKERAEIAAKLANMVRTDTLKQNTDGSNEPTVKISNEKAAELLGVSVSSVKRAKVEAEVKAGKRKSKVIDIEVEVVETKSEGPTASELQSCLNERDPVNVSRIMQMLAGVLVSSIDTDVGYNSFKEFEHYWNDTLKTIQNKEQKAKKRKKTLDKEEVLAIVRDMQEEAPTSEFNKFGEEQFLMQLAA